MSENKQNKKSNNPFGDYNPNGNQNKFVKNILIWLVLTVGILCAVVLVQGNTSGETKIAYFQYKELLEKNLIYEVTIVKSQSSTVDLKAKLRGVYTVIVNGKDTQISSFTTKLGVLDNETEKLWESKGINIKYEDGDNFFWGTLLSLLPIIVIFLLIMFLMRRMQGGGGPRGIFSFGKARIKLMNENTTKVTFNDVAGADEAKYELQEVIEFLKEPGKFRKLGGKIPRGVLLLGPPGTGKTLLARAVAGEAEVPFFSISGADFVEMFVGVGASRVRDLFEQAKKNSPCIVFIDEIDAVGRQRGAGLGGGHDEREQTLNQLLVEMDGFEQNSGVIIIAATNRPDVLDPALMRPGRFDRQVVVDRPDVKGREGIFKVHVSKVPLGEDVDLVVLSKGTPGLSGADIANIVNEACLLAARRNSEKVTMYDFENAKDKVLMGVERKSMVISDKEKEMTAYHEMGHALIGKLLEQSDSVHKVTIIPRGRALGVTSSLPNEDFHSWSRDYIDAKIVMLMGGRVAEKIVFNNLTTGASNDIERATAMARRMVCDWGMSDKLGPINYSTKQEEVFLGREIASGREFSEKTQEMIDEEVAMIISNANAKAEKILTENLDLLHKTSKILLEREILDGDELDIILRGEELPAINAKTLVALRSLKVEEIAEQEKLNETTNN
jgi:cell division protease FtsH